MNLKQVLAALADIKVVAGLFAGAGGLAIEAYARSTGNAEAVQVVGYVILFAGLVVTLVTLAQNSFGKGLAEGQKTVPHG